MRRAAGDAPEEALPISGKPPSVVARRNCTVAEKAKLSGVPETMLQTVYARAKESGNRGAIHDAKAEEIVGKLDYDFALAETMNPMVVARFKEKSIEGSHAKFTWGVKSGEALAELLPGFRFIEDRSLTEGMAVFAPIYKLLKKVPAVRNISNKISVLEKEA